MVWEKCIQDSHHKWTFHHADICILLMSGEQYRFKFDFGKVFFTVFLLISTEITKRFRQMAAFLQKRSKGAEKSYFLGDKISKKTPMEVSYKLLQPKISLCSINYCIKQFVSTLISILAFTALLAMLVSACCSYLLFFIYHPRNFKEIFGTLVSLPSVCLSITLYSCILLCQLMQWLLLESKTSFRQWNKSTINYHFVYKPRFTL